MRVRRAGILLVAALAAGAGHLAAQQGQGGGAPRRLAAPSLEELKTVLSLSPDQSGKVGKLIATWEGETKGAREVLTRNFQAMQSGGDVEALRAESMMAMQHLRERSEAMNAQIREVLSPEQNKAFDAWIAERAQRMRQGRPGGPPPALR
jgi:Spy/CpxP family protein refolding chaperone